MTPRDDASERQIQAAHPAQSTWVAANAGSGKTRVLIDRVARLLLRGTEPQRILCLTYTKAAATEMQNRLFQRLGGWAMLPDDTLRTDLANLGESTALGPDDLARARRLFARALETPGGLRIQTIHSFCATLLRRFPLEAGISPGFRELDDRAAKLLRAQIVEEMAESLAPAVMAEVAGIYTGEDFTALMEQVAGARHGFAAPLDVERLHATLGIMPGETEDSVIADCFLGQEQDLVSACLPVLKAGKKTDVDLADMLRLVDFSAPLPQRFEALKSACLTKTGTLRKTVPTADTAKALGPLLASYRDLAARIEAAQEPLIALGAAAKTRALHRFAAAFLPVYETAKSARGWLDFDDLIARAKRLLTDRSVAQWVLYRLDGGIDHILVDEAQDTSPDQWKVIELLAEEFTAGEGAQADRGRTLFVVGDKKQSIYSFQGADVAAFDEKHALFKAKFNGAGKAFVDMELSHSFRSAPAILKLVDETFAAGFGDALGSAPSHLAFRPDMPGRVDLWPLIEPVKTDEDENWDDPVDLIGETHHTAQLANRIAAEIRAMIDGGTAIIGENGKPRTVHAGDFLILVQRRSAVFTEVIRACKQQGLPIAGADRLKLGGELAVKDLAALLSFLATPEDDLSLAAVLRSPLCGWTEDELFRLAHGRKGYLWEALRDYPADSDTLQMLRDLRDQADFLRPFDLIDRILTRHQGRQRLLARLGDEAEDGIDELLSQALGYEQTEVPSLTGFLIWMQTDEITVKRQMDGAGDKIRVMTVHGAKGLEAPIVILPDTADRNPRDLDEIYRLPDGLPVWKTPADASPAAIREARARRKADQAAESARLLYVALTRPRSWLIVAGAGEAKTERKEGPKPVQDWAWYRLVERAMQAIGAVPTTGGVLRWANGDWPAPVSAQPDEIRPDSALPVWTATPAPEASRPARPLSPSDLGGAKALPGESLSLTEEAAKARGSAVHLLLEHLPLVPAADWPVTATALIPEAGLCADALTEARRLLQAPDLGWIFAPDALAEAPFCARIGEALFHGSIDRLVVLPDRVAVVDFKSNSQIPATPDQVPEGILRQMGAYVAALRQVYPDRPIQPYLLWTRSARLMPLDPEMVSAALHRAAIP
ncbi:double-strand break repair helicase AddA [Tabrizicola oligotrophica]|uniref:DNA 3'-5' helicase n=1 Tax=Tabrizicola oligotrophica TaxID=2710650 RepID=A0A6M0QV20_9RHOB|nr:double-strand break repair helicase AddA [Tabrizicola oligotrophica]NEY90322.1 double-strand break repair helicase AddA [Tabrizicola oligotrophica]